MIIVGHFPGAPHKTITRRQPWWDYCAGSSRDRKQARTTPMACVVDGNAITAPGNGIRQGIRTSVQNLISSICQHAATGTRLPSFGDGGGTRGDVS